MNNLEDKLKDCISKEIEKGIIENCIKKNLESCINDSIKEMFGWSGDVKKIIQEKIKEVIIPYLERYDYSRYITKLDSVLASILKESTAENRKLLENFQTLMSSDKEIKNIKLSEIYDK